MDLETPKPEKRAHEDGAALLRKIGELVRSERARRGITRRALARECQTSERYLAQIENGTGNPSVLVLDAIARAFELDAADLLPGGATPRHLSALSSKTLAALLRTTLTPLQPPDRARRVALIGLRGAGKSTLGKALAGKLGTRFIEVDALIEARHGAPIATLFEVYGHSAFRRYERECLEEVYGSCEAAVIATAGGVVADAQTYAQLLQRTHVIWLQAAPADHMRRVMAQGDFRPMEERRDAMEDLVAILDARAADHARAHAWIDTSGRSIEECVEELVELTEKLFARG